MPGRTLVHRAAPMGREDTVQRCIDCGARLKDLTTGGWPCFGTPYPPGSLVEIGPSLQAMVFQPLSPSCLTAAADDETYASYRAQREHSPRLPLDYWARTFPHVHALEQRYQQEHQEPARVLAPRR